MNKRLGDIFRLLPHHQAGLEKLGLVTAADLLRYPPAAYRPPAPRRRVAEITPGETVTVEGRIINQEVRRARRRPIPLGTVTVSDGSGKIIGLWFNQSYLAKKFPLGTAVTLRGQTKLRGRNLYVINPEIEKIARMEGDLWSPELEPAALTPVYPETRGLSSTWFYHAIKKLLTENIQQTLPDPLPAAILERYHLPTLATALVWLHSPRNEKDAEAARKRFAFEEVFLLQLERARGRREYQNQTARAIACPPETLNDFLGGFDFELTGAQRRAIDQILSDFKRNRPMLRLLEGDVGSGKTAVAAATAFAAVAAGFEVAYLAPTEILARQHFESFIGHFRHRQTPVGLITGSECRKFPSKINPEGHTNIARPQFLKWVLNGEIPIVIGTHALISTRVGQATTVRFKNLAYAIIDEQHRFGVGQRAALTKKNRLVVPHLLSMTATPIPRTLALTIYGDLDLTLLDELPPGRRPIITKIVAETEREKTYEHVRQELKAGRQAYVICPRIDEPDPDKELALQVKSVKAEQKRLREKIFPDLAVGLVHSKLKPPDKEATMREFAAGRLNILVATSVVEVGVNVPNATIILIEGAERFGLAQLHQLRGRVLRSRHQAYCYLFTSQDTKTANRRLAALAKAKNGFELAELDLKLRGPGALAGNQQWGLSDLGMEALRNLKMVEAARKEAQAMVAADPELKNHPLLATQLARQGRKEIHFE